MKRIVIIAAMLLMTFAASAQNAKTLYNKYHGRDGVSAVYVSPTLFAIAKMLPLGDTFSDITGLIRKFNGMYVLDCERPSNKAIAKDVAELVSSSQMDLLLEAADDGEITRIYASTQGDVITELLIVDEEDDCFDLIAISAEIPLSEMGKFIDKF